MSADNAANFHSTMLGGGAKQNATNLSSGVIDIGFNDYGIAGAAPTGLFYEPQISKPIRGLRSLTIRYDEAAGKLEGIPKVWRELLAMPQQKDELEEIDETLEINKRKLN